MVRVRVETLAKRKLHVRRDCFWWRASWPVRRHDPGARPPGDPCAGVKPVELIQRVTAAVRAQFGHPTGFWGRAAGLLMAHRTSNRRRNAWAVSLLDVRPEDRVLEIGFGPGIAIRELGRLAWKGYVCGIDHSELMLRRAKRLNAEGLRRGVVDLRLGSVPEDLLAVNATMFWREPVARLEELRRLLRSGGLIAVAHQPRGPGASDETSAAWGLEMEAALAQAGFSEVRLETMALKPAVVCALGVNRGTLEGGARSPSRSRPAGAGARPSGQLGSRPVPLELAALQRSRAEVLRLGGGRLGRTRPIRLARIPGAARGRARSPGGQPRAHPRHRHRDGRRRPRAGRSLPGRRGRRHRHLCGDARAGEGQGGRSERSGPVP